MNIRPIAASAFLLLTTAACTAASPSDSTASSASDLVTDAAQITQNADGTFEVRCRNGQTESAVPAAKILANEICPPLRLTLYCFLSYVTNPCPGDACPEAKVARLAKTFDGFPELTESLGSASLVVMPFSAEVHSTTAGGDGPTDGFIRLAIHDNATGGEYSSESKISLTRASGDPDVPVLLRQSVVPFKYQGASYDGVELLCYEDR